jgi:hypothetical protein
VDELTITPGGDGVLLPSQRIELMSVHRKKAKCVSLNIVTSPRRERSASIAVIDSFLLEYQKRIKGVVVDTLDVWTESLREFDAEAVYIAMTARDPRPNRGAAQIKARR